MVDPEIIDLTGSSPSIPTVALVSDDEVIFVESGEVTPQTANGGGQDKKKRKKKRAGKVLEDGEIDSAVASRAQSPERGGRERPGRERSNGENGETNGLTRSRKKSLLDRIEGTSAGGRSEGRRRDEPEPQRREERRRRRRDSRSPQRDRARERRSRSPERRRRQKDPSSPSKAADLFFEDVKPAEIPSPAKLVVQASTSMIVEKTLPEGEPPALLLPAHVSVFGQNGVEPVEILPPPSPASDDGDYIDYLDYDDDRRGPWMVRYFESTVEQDKQPKPSRTVCKNCGAEGEHKTYECPVIICLTCGARDEHSTRSCPISKTCFNCGMRGHINKTCPTRHSGRGDVGHYDDCDRCGARTHSTKECPTLWRMYSYVDDDERQAILLGREEKRALPLGQGGEGYIAADEWCYNCGGCGHLGDDCKDMAHPQDFPREPSAFSAYNTLSGPFSDLSIKPHSKAKRAPRDWEVADAFVDQRGVQVPMDVGKQGKRKERQRMAKRALEEEQAEDDPDWFSTRRRTGGGGGGDSRGGAGGGGNSRSKGGGKKIDIGFANGRSRVSYADLPGPSRETDNIRIRGAARRGDDKYDGRDRERDRDRGSSRRDDRGPRYRGGYAR